MAWVRALALRLAGDDEAALELLTRARAQARAVGGGPHAAWCDYERWRIAGDPRARMEALTAARRFGLDGLLERLENARVVAPTAPVPRATFSLRRDGDGWRVDHAGRSFQLRDTKGVRMLARLIAQPGCELHALELSDAALEAGHAGELLDDRAREDYRQRLRALRGELAEAEAFADLGRSERARAEIDALSAELSRAFGLGGRKRRAGDAAERARVNVQRRLRDAVRRIGEHDEALGRHLAWAVRTGAFCCYQPG